MTEIYDYLRLLYARIGKTISPVSGKASLEVYNLFGQKLQTVYEGFIHAGRSQVVQLRTASVSSGVMIYKFRINDKQVTGRLISIRE